MSEQIEVRKEGPRSKEQHIQFLRGPMTDLVKRTNIGDTKRLNKGLHLIDEMCQKVNSVKDN